MVSHLRKCIFRDSSRAGQIFFEGLGQSGSYSKLLISPNDKTAGFNGSENATIKDIGCAKYTVGNYIVK